VTGALKPFLDGHREQFVIDGAPAHVEAADALLLTMAIHELATNATKYGALSNGKGNVSVVWTAHECERRAVVRLSWKENGGSFRQCADKKGIWLASR